MTATSSVGRILGQRVVLLFTSVVGLWQVLPALGVEQEPPPMTNVDARAEEAVRLQRQVELRRSAGKYSEATELAQKALTIHQELYPPARFPDGHIDVSTSLNTCGLLFLNQGRYKEARSYFEQSLDMLQKLYPPNRFPNGHSDLATVLSNIGSVLYDEGKLNGAKQYMEQALAMRQKLYPANTHPDGHPDLAVSLNNLGTLVDDLGDYRSARRYLEQALAMWRRLHPPERFPAGHENIAACLNNLGTQVSVLGDYPSAIRYLEEALAIKGKLYPESRYPNGHPDIAITLNNLASVCRFAGDRVKARRYGELALAMRQKAFPPDRYPTGHPDLARSFSILAGILEEQGDYGGARRQYEAALAILERFYKPPDYPDGHEHIAGCLDGLGLLLGNQGNYSLARRHLERSLTIRRKLYPSDRFPSGSLALARSLNNLGAILLDQEDFEGAERLYQESLVMLEKLLPAERYPSGHRYLAGIRDNLAVVSARQQKYPEAQRYLHEAFAIQRKLYPPDRYPAGHADLAKTLNTLGGVLFEHGEDAAARQNYDQALAMLAKLYPQQEYPDGQEDIVTTLSNRAKYYFAKRDFQAMRRDCEQALAMTERLFEALRDSMSERERYLYLRTSRNHLDLFLCLVAEGVVPAENGYDHVLRWRGADRQVLFGGTLTLEENPRIQTLDRELAGARRELARWTYHKPDAATVEERQQQLQFWANEKERLQRELSHASASYRRQNALNLLTAQQVAQTIPDGTALIDLLEYSQTLPRARGTNRLRAETRYLAFVIRPPCNGRPAKLTSVNLGPADEINQLAHRWQRLASEPDAASSGASEPIRQELGRLVWKPLVTHVQGSRQILVVPDGPLGLVPFAALPGTTALSCLLEELAIGYLTDPQQLVALVQGPPLYGKGLVILGGVDYERVSARPSGFADAPGATAVASTSQFRSVPDEVLRQFGPLPGTLAECRKIAELFRAVRINEPPPILLTGTASTKDELLRNLPDKRYIHLATHGFFATGQLRSYLANPRSPDAPPRKSSRRKLAADMESAVGMNPMLLCGIALAGANQAPTAGRVGIMTAEEVAAWKLKGVELVVLSACQTALGEFERGQGMLSLQRAFHHAGARSLVSSLWKVDDTATQVLMTEFYTNLWQKKLGKLEALRQAQLAMMRRYDPKVGKLRGPGEVQPVDPEALKKAPTAEARPLHFHWAAFVLSGDWQ
jgi:CHAT domain-containing protein/Tfp pilus assembly protein PilF